jgi:hypothetical protein
MRYLITFLVFLGTSLVVRAEPADTPVQAPERQTVSPEPDTADAPTVAMDQVARQSAPEQQRTGAPAGGNAGFGLDICADVRSAAAEHNLPAEFFTKLIWQESRFNPRVVSRAGAQGIAQFMPSTARWRGLADPFDPVRSIRESARWLGELRTQFGNLGLAAAAYNAGPKRVQDWLSGKRGLPQETRAYVSIITGRAAEEWTQPGVRDDHRLQVAAANCSLKEGVVAVAFSPVAPSPMPQVMKAGARREPVSKLSTWSLQLIGGRSETGALAEYRNLQKKFPAILGSRPPLVMKRQLGGPSPAIWYQIRLAENSRERANALCSRLRSAGGQCLVLNN